MPTPDQVAHKAEAYSRAGSNFGVGMCLKFSRLCAGANGGVPDAISAWRNANYRHTTGTPPRGSFVYWSGGSAGHGHVAVSAGGGAVWTTDFKRTGRVDRVSIAAISKRWRNIRYEGWAEDINGVHAAATKSSSTPTPSAASTKPAAQRSHTVKSGDTLWDIAEAVYGNGQDWKKIAKANGIKDGDQVDVGQKLVLP